MIPTTGTFRTHSAFGCLSHKQASAAHNKYSHRITHGHRRKDTGEMAHNIEHTPADKLAPKAVAIVLAFPMRLAAGTILMCRTNQYDTHLPLHVALQLQQGGANC